MTYHPRLLRPGFVGLTFCLMTLPFIRCSLVAGDPPLAAKHPHPLEQFGVKWSDDYFWLRDRENPAVRDYLEAENAYRDEALAPLSDLRKILVEEMKSRIIEDDVSVPYRRGEWLYYSREVAGKEHPLICRKPFRAGSPDDLFAPAAEGSEVILLDLNERAGGDSAYTFGGGAVSRDATLYAWKENHDGTDLYTIRVKNLESGALLPDEIEGAVYDVAPVWAMDGKTIFFTEGDDTNRPWRVRSHGLGNPPGESSILYEERDPRFSVAIEATKSGRFLLITASSKDTSETSIVPLDEPSMPPVIVRPRIEGLRYSIADCGDHWFILTNEGAINGRVFRSPLGDLTGESWLEVLPGDEKIAYQGIDAFATHVVLGARREGVPGFFILDPDKGTTRWITPPGEGASLGWEPSPEYESATQRFSYDTFTRPYVVAEVGLADGEIRTLKEKARPAGFDPERYRIEKTFASASDGTKIRIWLLLPADHPSDGSGGMLLDGYGAYGYANDPWFDSDVFSLLDRGVGFAIAQVRGGGEFGRPWYEAGKLADKANTFTDYIACAEHLIAEGYTSAARLCGTGASAGGLLAGAVLNVRPEFFAGFVANVPFVDVLNTMLDASIPLTTGEYDEWGNPEATREVFDRIRSYSPYDNVETKSYPPILVMAGWNDNRVAYWEPAKWVAKMRALNGGQPTLVLSTEFETGHGGASGRYSGLEEVALQYAFVLNSTGRAAP